MSALWGRHSGVAKRGLPPIPAFGIGWLYPVCPTGNTPSALTLPPSVPQQIGVGPPRLRIVRIRMRQVKRQRAAGAGAVAEAEEEIAQGAGAEREFRVAFHVQGAFLLQVVHNPVLV